MLFTGLLMSVAGVAMLVGAFLLPASAKPGLIAGGIGVGAAGLLLMALDWPSRKKPPREGMVQAYAYLLDSRPTGGEVTGYRMVELTLEVRPKDGVPFQVKRKFVANRVPAGSGGRLKVYYDPVRPEIVELGS